MSEISKYEAYKKKLQGVCDENNLIFRFRKDKYPIRLTIRPAGGLDCQLSMMENVEEKGYTSPDATLVFSMENGVLTYKTSRTFTIDDALFAKLKNLFKNMYSTWLEFFFRDIMERGLLSARNMPVIDEGEDDGPDDEDDLEDEDDLDEEEDVTGAYEGDPDANDPEINRAIMIVRSVNKASVAMLQRQMNVGYAKAAQLMDALEKLGVVGPYNGSSPREVLPWDAPEDPSDDMDELKEGEDDDDEA